MKLKKIIFAIVGVMIAGIIIIGEYQLFQEKTKNSIETIIIAGTDIKKGEKITIDKLAITNVTKPCVIPAVRNPNEVIGKYAPYDILRGEPIIKNKLLDRVYVSAYNEYATIVKVEVFPITFIEKYENIKLLYMPEKNPEKPAKSEYIDNVRVFNMYDAGFRTAEEIQKQQQQNNYQPIGISYIEVGGDKEKIKAIKEKEKEGTFVVIKKE